MTVQQREMALEKRHLAVEELWSHQAKFHKHLELVSEPGAEALEEQECDTDKKVRGGQDRIAPTVYRAMEEGMRKTTAVPGVHREDKTPAPASALHSVPKEVTPHVSGGAVPYIPHYQ